MDGKDFAVRLKKIKAEILAYKQLQKSGAGRADFYRYKFPSYNFDEPNQKVIVKFHFNVDEQPMFQLYGSAYLKTVAWNDGILTIKAIRLLIANDVIVIARVPTEVEVEYED